MATPRKAPAKQAAKQPATPAPTAAAAAAAVTSPVTATGEPVEDTGPVGESRTAARQRQAETGVEMVVVDGLRFRKGEEKSGVNMTGSPMEIRSRPQVEMVVVDGIRYRADDADGIAAAKKRVAARDKQLREALNKAG